ncbi:MAG: DUF4398 domain-containing protein [Marinobacter sp.]|nr:DUF4398 domain-containing protein [Marinobacter sp.]
MYQSINQRFGDRIRGALTIGVATVLLTACVTSPQPPTGALTAAEEAIASAEQAGARQHAGAEFDEAMQKLEKAEQSVRAERMTEAERLALEATIAAELASARTESAKAAAINREMGRGADALTEEMRRAGDQQ